MKMNKEESMSWGELAELTHATQLERFNWCMCEEQESFPYDDCPSFGKHSEREAQAQALKIKEDIQNPLTIAEENPNRFYSVTFFFGGDDGIKIETDLDLNEVTVYYFDDNGASQRVITGGALYEWAISKESEV